MRGSWSRNFSVICQKMNEIPNSITKNCKQKFLPRVFSKSHNLLISHHRSLMHLSQFKASANVNLHNTLHPEKYRDISTGMARALYPSPHFDLLFSILFRFLGGKRCRWSFKWPEAVGGISGVKARRERERESEKECE